MKLLQIALVQFLSPGGAAENLQYATDDSSCDFTRLINYQINYEQSAAHFYHQMSFKFRHHSQPRPNFVKMLLGRAKEENEHAQIFADFQLERGADIEFMPIPVEGQELKTMLDVLKASLAKEEELSQNLVEILHLAEDGCTLCAESKDILVNSKCQAPHIADLITGQFLPEQYKDIHHLKGLITNLEQMTHGVPQAQRVFNELFFDSQLD